VGPRAKKFWKIGVLMSPNNIMVSCLEAENYPTILSYPVIL
jgi:hypothetical protein